LSDIPRLTRSLPLLGSDVESYVAEPFDSYRWDFTLPA